MDSIFDRLETLLKSFISGSQHESPNNHTSYSGDPDLDEAMAELEADLAGDREAKEKLEKEREARRQAETGTRTSREPVVPERILKDYKILGLQYGASFTEVKAAYKKLLKEYHPDRHGNSPELQKTVTEKAARINDAFRRLKIWSATGKLPDDN